MTGATFDRAELDAIKAAVPFGDACTALGLKGSSKAGWQCVCGGPETLKERSDHKGGSCEACGSGFDVLGIVMAMRGLTLTGAARWLSEVTPAQDDEDTLDLFGGAS